MDLYNIGLFIFLGLFGLCIIEVLNWGRREKREKEETKAIKEAFKAIAFYYKGLSEKEGIGSKKNIEKIDESNLEGLTLLIHKPSLMDELKDEKE